MPTEKEINKLTRRFGDFERVTFEYNNLSPGFSLWVKKLTRRRGEIVLVVPRGDKILLHTKPHYPVNVFRLPTGGVRQGEDVRDAARREAFEELGFKPQDLRLLGILDNLFSVGKSQISYPSFVFKTPELVGEPTPTDPDELISGFRDVDRLGIRAVAAQLSNLPPEWREWGRFRAAPHAWLAENWTR